MDKNQKILDEVKKTISLLDDIKNIEPNPFLYTRIKAAFDSESRAVSKSSTEFAVKILQRIVFAVLFLFNAYSVISYLSDSDETAQTRQQYIKNFVSEYSINTETDYITNDDSRN